MRRLRLWVIACALVLGCTTDIRLLRSASASYSSAVVRHDAKCVHTAAPTVDIPMCEREKAELLAARAEIDGYLTTYLLGPLPEDARERLKRIGVELKPTPVAR